MWESFDWLFLVVRRLNDGLISFCLCLGSMARELQLGFENPGPAMQQQLALGGEQLRLGRKRRWIERKSVRVGILQTETGGGRPRALADSDHGCVVPVAT